MPAEGPTGCSPLRHRPTARPWACHPEPEGPRGPTHVGAGGSVPVPAASLDGARRTGCERRRPAGVRCRMVPGWPRCRGDRVGTVALPVLPVQPHLLLWPRLVSGWEALEAGAVGTAVPQLQTPVQPASVASDEGVGAAQCRDPATPPNPTSPMKKPLLLLSRRTPFKRKPFCFLSKPVVEQSSLRSRVNTMSELPASSRRQTVLQVLTQPGGGTGDLCPPPGWLGSILCPPGAWDGAWGGCGRGGSTPRAAGGSSPRPHHAAELQIMPHGATGCVSSLTLRTAAGNLVPGSRRRGWHHAARGDH